MKRAEQRVGWVQASWKEFRKVGRQQVSVDEFTGEKAQRKRRDGPLFDFDSSNPHAGFTQIRLFLRLGRAPCLPLCHCM